MKIGEVIMSRIQTIESRFKEVTGLTHLDLSTPHFKRDGNQQQKTTKEEYKKFGFVTTPLWLVDEMLEPQIPNLTLTSTTCDACAGCGQFSIRLMRKLHDKFINMGASESQVGKWISKVWLAKLHYFTEFQFSNVAKLIYIFGPDINVYIGDSLNMKYAKVEDHSLLFFNSKKKEWLSIPNLYPEVEKRKDNLSDLITFFTVLESSWNKINCQ